ncbi:diaminopimelate decarboxylase [Anaerobiospirillum sp. NML120448]|uniref:diaminopimelate decarboxylase n=1 Tax=Anaerobiospirillum sp. NML120448 TaxID=2932816 RepID=UPI001FF34580|nr:diaminopimelate decarboxylase [Anaerobiospirillum sp. NML120448]MCK0514765.1 diaminopimelate decarboxylase [Anaerobiospirillum sp. NML120448]
MDFFNYKDNELYAEDIKVTDLVERYGSPLYVYSKATLVRHLKAFEEALAAKDHLICYAVKANSSLAILNTIAKFGCGFDVVSKGELMRVIKAGGDPGKVIYSGVGKREDEIEFALQSKIKCLNIESESELYKVEQVAKRLSLVAPVALRVNPNVDAKTHPSISTGLKKNKFGIAFEDALRLYTYIANSEHLQATGIDCHIGSQMTSGAPIIEATDKLISLYHQLEEIGIKVDHIDIGGGLGVTYNDETPPSPYEYLAAVIVRLKDIDVSIYCEPGRAMVANAGILLTNVLYLKSNSERNFCIVDAAMGDLIRPALYNSWMNIIPAVKRDPSDALEGSNANGTKLYDVVGPICESDDYLGKDRHLNVREGDVLAVRGAGAYGSSMSSNYNSRPLCAEILVDGDKAYVIRERQKEEDMWLNERIIDA